MNKVLSASVGLLAVVIAAGGGYWYALHEGQAELQAALDRVRSALGPDGSLSYARAAVHPFSHSAELSQVALRTKQGLLVTADSVTLVDGDAPGKLASLHAIGARIAGSVDQGVMTASTVDVKEIMALPSGAGQSFDPAVATFADADLHDISFHTATTSFTLTSLEISDYGAGRPSAIRASMFSTPVPDVQNLDHLDFTSASISGIDIASVVNAVERHLKMPMLSNGASRIEMDGAHALNGGHAVISVEKGLFAGTTGADAASSGRFDVSGVIVDPTGAQAKEFLLSVGLNKIEGDLSVKGAYNLAGGQLRISPTLQIAQVGQLSIDLQLAHLDLSAFTGGTASVADLMSLVTTTQLVSASAEFNDGGLMDRLLQVGSRKTGMPTNQLRAQAVIHINQDPELGTIPQGEQIRTALAGFVAKGGRLGVSLRPQVPVSVLDLAQAMQADPVSMAAQFGMTVSSGGTSVEAVSK